MDVTGEQAKLCNNQHYMQQKHGRYEMHSLTILVGKIYGKNTALISRNSRLTTWSEILLENKSLPSHFMEPEGAVPRSQQPFYLQPDKFSPLPQSIS